MEIIGFIGPSGTGKSHRAAFVAKSCNADCFIDDGLLISGGKILAGTSAKREATRIASVKHALFIKPGLSEDIKNAVLKHKPERIMILGTSDEMVDTISKNLSFPEVSKRIYINDVATKEEIAHAQQMRNSQGKHVIPIPTFEIKDAFSGYFLHPMKFFNRKFGNNEETIEKTIVRPTYSYLGEYLISDSVLVSLAKFETEKNDNVLKVFNIKIVKEATGIVLNIHIICKYGANIPMVAKEIMNTVGNFIEHYTSINVLSVNIFVKSLE